MSTISIELYGTNPNAPEHGYYSEIDLPASSGEIKDKCARARIAGTPSAGEFTITESAVEELTDKRIDGVTLPELSFLAKRLETLSETEIIAYRSLIRPLGDMPSMKDLINLTYGLDAVPVWPAKNAAEYGEMAIENELYTEFGDEFENLPDSIVRMFDNRAIGTTMQQVEDGVFLDGYYVVPTSYEKQEVYNGVTLPESEDDYVFRLQIAEAPVNDSEETIDKAVWISLPIDRAEADRLARSLNESFIEDCVYYGFESAIPQIDSELFGDMLDFDKFNRLATKVSLMSETDRIKFRAVLEANPPKDMDAAIQAADSLWKYEMTSAPESSSQFFKQYLAHHLNSKFDAEWLDTLLTGNEGDRLLDRLGASMTNYGVISACGHSLYELVPYNKPPEISTETMTDEKLEVIEILGREALFSNGRIADDEIPAGLYRYDLRYSDDEDRFCSVEPHVGVNHGGTVLLREMLDFGENGYISLDDDSAPNFNGEMMTAQEFADELNEEQTGGMTL